MTDGEVKESFVFSRAANGNSSLTCTRTEGNISVRFSVKTFTGTLSKGVEEAREGAQRSLNEIKEATRDQASPV